MTENYDALRKRIPEFQGGYLPWMGAAFCSAEDHATVKAFFEPRIAELRGGPRNLAGSLEAIELCAARVAAHQINARKFFAAGAE